MGHYYSEMHVPTPQETYLEKVKQARLELGFKDYDIDYRHWFVCGHCGCMVLLLRTHLQNCQSISKKKRLRFFNSIEAAKYQIIASLATKVATNMESDELSRSSLLDECTQAGICALAFDMAIGDLKSEHIITNYIDRSLSFEQRQYRDESFIFCEVRS